MLLQRQVYVLDDDKSTRHLLHSLLTDEGYAVYETESWVEAGQRLLRAEKNHRSVFICDLNMPGIRGDEFCKTVVKHCPEVRIILFSGETEHKLQDATSRLGSLANYVVKGAGPETLLTKIEEAFADEACSQPASTH